MVVAVLAVYVATTSATPTGNSPASRKPRPGRPGHVHGQELGVDAKRIGLTGWSFGGFQTQYTLYTNPNTFAAGIAGAGNQISSQRRSPNEH